jgi:glycosyltransferase involved in cell wall biosynthesis
MSQTDKTLVLAETIPEVLLGLNEVQVSLSGWWYGTSVPRKIDILVDGSRRGQMQLGVPVPQRLKSTTDNASHGIGVAGEVTIPASATKSTHTVEFVVSGSVDSVHSLTIQRPALEQLEVADGVEFVICMAVYNPANEVFKRQIQSIIDQDVVNWVCIVNDDGSDPSYVQQIHDIIAQDSRFYYFRNTHNVGFYGNFEIALSRVPPNVSYVALADQDDRWNSDKLRSLRDKLDEGFELVYSDLRIVDDKGSEISPSYWGFRRNHYQNLKLLLVANTVTGAACLFRRQLLDLIMPFPPRIGDAFHDHWIACAALAKGKIGYVDRVLYDYYQHGESIIGHCDFDQTVVDPSARLSWRLFVNPKNWPTLMGRVVGSSTGIYWFECRRIESICSNLEQRLGHSNDAFAIFGRGVKSAWRLLRLFMHTSESKRLTNRAELRLARAYLLHGLRSKIARSRQTYNAH